jgi:hypothetical protein
MNFHVQRLTPTQLAIKERRANFRKSIAEKAEELKIAKERPKVAFEKIEAPKKVIEILSEQSIWPWPYPIEFKPGTTPSILEIQVEVAKHFSLGVNELMAERRTAKIVRARQVACYLCRELTLFSLPVIGKKFGGRDHTTILYAAKKIASLMLEDADLAHDVAHLIEQITGTQQ